MGKLLLKIAAGIGLLLIVLFGVILWNINPIINKLRPQITEAISNAVQHPVVLGEIDASLFPGVALEVADAGLADPEGNISPNASAKRLVLRTSLRGLLSGNITVSEFLLEDASVRIERSAAGEITVGGIAVKRQMPQTAAIDMQSIPEVRLHTAASTTAAPPEPAAEAGSSEASVELAIESAALNNANITFVDKMVSPQQEVRISDISGTVENIGRSRQGMVLLSASALGTRDDNISLEGTFSMAGGPGGLPGGDLQLAARSIDLPALHALAAAYGVKVDKLSLSQTADLKARARLDQKGIYTAVNDFDASAAAVTYAELISKKAGLPAVVSIDAYPTLSGAVKIEKASVTIGEVVLSAAGMVAPAEGANVRVTSASIPLSGLEVFLVPVRGLNLRGAVIPDVAVRVPPGGGEPKTDGTVALENISADVPLEGKKAALPVRKTAGTITLAGEQITLKPFQSEIAGQLFQLSATVSSYKNPRVGWTLSSNSVNLEQLAAAAGAQRPSLQGAALSGLNAGGTFIQANRSGTADIKVQSGSLAGAALRDIKLAADFILNANNSPASAQLKPSSFSAFGGNIKLNGSLADSRRIAATIDAAGLDLASVSKLAMADSAISLAGTLESMQADVRFDKQNPQGTLAGTSRANVGKGSIKGFNLLRETLGRIDSIPGVDGSLTAYVPEKHRAVLQSDGTEFESLSYISTIQSGTVQLEEALLSHPLYIVQGGGDIGLNGAVNLKAQLKLTPALAEEMVLKQPKLQLIMDKNRNIVVPIVIKKDKRLIVLPDMSQLVKRAAGNTAKEAVKRELDRVKPGLGQALDSLFK